MYHIKQQEESILFEEKIEEIKMFQGEERVKLYTYAGVCLESEKAQLGIVVTNNIEEV